MLDYEPTDIQFATWKRQIERTIGYTFSGKLMKKVYFYDCGRWSPVNRYMGEHLHKAQTLSQEQKDSLIDSLYYLTLGMKRPTELSNTDYHKEFNRRLRMCKLLKK